MTQIEEKSGRTYHRLDLLVNFEHSLQTACPSDTEKSLEHNQVLSWL